MEKQILDALATNGPFVLLFVYLLFYVLNQNAKREAKYQTTIDQLVARFGILDDVHREVTAIKEHLEKEG